MQRPEAGADLDGAAVRKMQQLDGLPAWDMVAAGDMTVTPPAEARVWWTPEASVYVPHHQPVCAFHAVAAHIQQLLSQGDIL